MQINEDYWGGADKTTTLADGRELTNYTLMDALNTGFIPFNELLDTSISPWAISSEADLTKISYALTHREGTSGYVWADPEIYPIHDTEADNKGIPFYFCVPYYTGNSGLTFNWFSRNGYSQQQILDTSANTLRDQVYILRGFDYNKLAYYPQLVVAEYTRQEAYNDSTFCDVATTSIPNYFNNYEYWSTRPIVGIKFTPYYQGADPSYPDYRIAIELNVNSLGIQKPCQETGTEGAINGYTTDFIDNFMSMIPSGGTIGSYGYYSALPIHDLNRDYWVQSYSEDVDLVLAADGTNVRFFSAGYSSEIDTTRHWFIESLWPGGNDVYIRSALSPASFTDSDELKDYILKQIAYLGVWFCLDPTEIQSTAPGSTANWYLGEIDADGITTGRYEQGSNTSQLPNSTWVDPWEESGWSGRSEDPNTYSDHTDWNSSLTTGLVQFSKAFILTPGEVETLHAKFYDSLSNIPSGSTVTDYLEATYLTNNPTDVIMSLRYYYMDLDTVFPTALITDLNLGAYNTGMQAKWIYPGIKKFDMGSCTYYPHFGDFRDYDPYSSAQLIIPYCGTVKISPSEFMGRKISVTLGVDFTTGACTAYIFRDDLMVSSISGQIGIETPVSGVASSDLQRDIYNSTAALKQAQVSAEQSLVSGAFSTLAAAATGNIAGAAQSIMGMYYGTQQADIAVDVAEYNLEHTNVPYRQVGAAAPALNFMQEQNCRLLIYRPVMKPGYDPESYGKTTGFATIETDILSSFSGFTKCGAVKADGISCTATEKKMIIDALQSGVYL